MNLYFIKKFLHFYKTPIKRDIFYHDYKNIEDEIFDREQFILSNSKDLRVLHFGFLDYPFNEQKLKDKTLLHTKLIEIAKSTYGIDINSDSMDKYREFTKDYNNCNFDIAKRDLDIQEFDFLKDKCDLILFPEVLEHLQNPGIALCNLLKISKINENSKVCITVPNAFSIIGFCAALKGKEIVHPDHYYYFSPTTIKRLLEDVGFNNIEIKFYVSEDLSQIHGLIKNGLIITCTA